MTNFFYSKHSATLILLILLFVLVFVPVLSFAQIIPNCSPNCGYYDLLQLVNNIIRWIIMISFPVAAGVFAWAGFIYMTSAVADKKSEAKGMFIKVFVGFVIL